jgi:hypothetical protein
MLELYIENGYRTPLMLEYRNEVYNVWLIDYRKKSKHKNYEGFNFSNEE